MATVFADEDEPEGRTPGYWKNHLDAWVGYSPNETLYNAFGMDLPELAGMTLLDALNANGGGIDALARHAAAALLNACDEDIAYPVCEDWLRQAVSDAADAGEPCVTQLKDQFDEWNNLGCPEDAD